MDVVLDNISLEVCVDSVESAIAAVKGGADRLEICGNLVVGGGVTPSMGLVKCIQNVVDAPLMIMIRPRIGDFVYSADEVDVMLEDIRAFKELGSIRGFVIGALTSEGQIDSDSVKLLVDEILPLEVSFHRAFDMTKNAEQALRDIIEIGGISRILTSGHAEKVTEGLETLQSLFSLRKEFFEDEPWAMSLMPGSGVSEQTVRTILEVLVPLGMREIHLSGGKWEDGLASFKKEGLGMGAGGQNDWSVWHTQEEAIRRVRNAVDAFWKARALAGDTDL